MGGTIRSLIDILKPTGAEITCAYVVVKRGEGALSVPLHYLFTLDELLQ